MLFSENNPFSRVIVSQFFGALNDNFFRTLVLLVMASHLTAASGGIWQICLAEALFLLPYVVFSPLAGILADRYPKPHVLRICKIAEIFFMGLAVIGFMQMDEMLLIALVFAMGLQSTIFSPSKYGLLPEVTAAEDISKVNGTLEFWTFGAIIIGVSLAGIVLDFLPHGEIAGTVIAVAFAIIGWGVLINLPVGTRRDATNSASFNPVRELIGIIRYLKGQPTAAKIIMASAWFWAAGVAIKLVTIVSVTNTLHASNSATSIIFAFLALGIGSGSMAAGRLSGGNVEIGLVPLGSLLISLSTLGLTFAHSSVVAFSILMFLVGCGGGLFIVPLNASLQTIVPNHEVGRVLAANNQISNVFMVATCGLVWFLSDVMGMTPAAMFFILTISGLVATGIVLLYVKGALIRMGNWIVTHTFYKLNVVGRDHVPSTGGALLVANHASYVDACLILASLSRNVRFLIYRPIYEHWLIKPFASRVGAIPIDSEESPKKILKALAEARKAIQQGDLVCIFAEGQITRIGRILTFNKGLERIVSGSEAPVIPVYLDKIWGSIFSFRHGKFFWKKPRELPYPVAVTFGAPLAGDTPAWKVRASVQELAADICRQRQRDYLVLPDGFLRTVREAPFRKLIFDSEGREVRAFSLLGGSIAFFSLFASRVKSDRMVGIMLPPGLAGVYANIGCYMGNKIPVNLNFTSSEDSISSAIEQCGIETVITSRKLVEKLEMRQRPEMIFVEDLLLQIGVFTKIKSCFSALFRTYLVLDSFFSRPHAEPDDLATVIFSSGSTGIPKGVMLSHANISSNVEAVFDVFNVSKENKILGVLPFFHSFGFTVTLWMPLLTGMKVVYHTSPLDAALVGELVHKYKVDFLVATPTFLLGYIRKCSAEQFATLKHVIVGAEKLKDALRHSFEKKFSVPVREGYGCTELSPVAIVNVEDYIEGDINQIGTKHGSVGHPLPGITAKIVDPSTYEEKELGEEGLLLVKGPNVMIGYLGMAEKTREVVRDGWYVTGDIATMDEDGFVTITDRISRFSKIAGEMVPHVKIEDLLQEALGKTERVVFVCGVPDEKKGEKLVVLSTIELETDRMQQFLLKKGLPNLWIPKSDAFFSISELPLLGSGKLDMSRLKELAREMMK